jgi:hypothetical protein
VSGEGPIYPERVSPGFNAPWMVVAEPVAGMVAPGEAGYDCTDCDSRPAGRKAYPEGLKMVLRYCPEHGINGRPEDS